MHWLKKLKFKFLVWINAPFLIPELTLQEFVYLYGKKYKFSTREALIAFYILQQKVETREPISRTGIEDLSLSYYPPPKMFKPVYKLAKHQHKKQLIDKRYIRYLEISKKLSRKDASLLAVQQCLLKGKIPDNYIVQFYPQEHWLIWNQAALSA